MTIETPQGRVAPARATLAAMCALLVGTGLARFAYTPLIPALVTAGWFVPAEAAYLGAANLVGYLAGAVLARWLASRVPAAPLLRAMMLVATLSFFACAAPLPFAWFFAWRLIAGCAGAVLMVLAAPSVLPHVPAARRGLAGGIIFTGVGIGIAVSGTLVPLLLTFGLGMTWCGLGALALALTMLAWGGWPPLPAVPLARGGGRVPRAFAALAASYALNAVGLVPHMIFLVDYVARGLGDGIAAGARVWVIVGIGAVIGPVVLGRLGDRIGFARSVRLAYLIQAALVGTLAVTANGLVLDLSSFVIGAYVPGITTLVLGRARELVAPDMAAQQSAWSIATASFAVGQAAGGWGLSALFARMETYAPLFAVAAGFLLAALALDLVSAWARAR